MNLLSDTNKPIVINQKLIIIDAGHGGEDGGAVVNKDGGKPIIEKNINLEIALKLCNLIKLSGHQVIMTREKDKSIHDSGCKRLREKKRSDLNNRLKIIEQYSSQDTETLLISIHQNKFTDEKYSGTQVFYSANNPKSEVLAEFIRNNIKSKIQPDNNRELKPSTSYKIFLLNKTKIPAVTVECGFLSNPSEVQKLINDDYQNCMVMSIFCGIAEYWLSKD